MYKTILIPIDASPCHEKVIHEGLELARIHNAVVTFLYVVEDPSIEVYGRSYGKELYRDYLRAGEETLAEALKRAQAANVAAKTLLIDKQEPADAILAAEEDHDLSVMGTHGRKGLSRMVIGSVTEEVMRHSKRPHLVVSCYEGGEA